MISPGDDAEPDDSHLPRFEQTSTFTAFEDVAASSVFWTGDGTLVVGGADNRELATWSLGDSDMVGAEETQRLSFAPAEDTYCVAKCAYPSANVVLLSNLRKNVVYAAHLASSGEGFDYVAEFSATMPVLSFAVAAEDGGEDADATAGTALQLYCMQTQAIQQYALHLDRCRPETARGHDESALVAEEDESDEEDADAEDEDEDATVAIPAGAGAGVKTPAPAPAPAEKTPSKLLSPTELMRVASGAKDVEPTADKPAPEKPPAPAKLPPAPKSAPPPPRGPPPRAPTTRHLRRRTTTTRTTRLRRRTTTSRRPSRAYARASTTTSPGSSPRSRRRARRQSASGRSSFSSPSPRPSPGTSPCRSRSS